MEDEAVNHKLTKRQRSENWKEEDKELLKDLVRKRVGKIENKNTDTNSNQSKKKAWLELEKDFNALSSSGNRSMAQLKSQWTCIKMQAKKEVSQFRAEQKKTGGGEAPAGVPFSGDDISAWLPNEFVTDFNEFDSDMALNKELEADEEELKESDAMVDCCEVEYLSGEEEVCTQTYMKEAKIIPAKTSHGKKKNKSGQNREELMKQIADVDVQCRRELHQLQMEVEQKKLRNMDELHQLQLEVERKKIRNMDSAYDLMRSQTNYFRNIASDT